jgi:hypothetical protein
MYRNLSHQQKPQPNSHFESDSDEALPSASSSRFDTQFQDPQLQLSQIQSQSQEPRPTLQNWITAFNTSLLTTQAHDLNRESQELKASDDLGTLMQSPEFHALIIAAQHLSNNLGYSKEEATERLIDTFRRLDRGWGRVVLNRGLNSLISKSSG